MEECSNNSTDSNPNSNVTIKKEIVEELEITFENNYGGNENFLLPKEELEENSDEHNNIYNITIKTNKMLTEEFIIPKEEITLEREEISQELDRDNLEEPNEELIKPIKVELVMSEEVVQIRHQEISDVDQSESLESQQSTTMIKTEAQRHREYRDRKKSLIESGKCDQESPRKKTEAERHREYRERRKRLAAESLDSQLRLPTSTSRVVKFRERALIKKLSSITPAHDASSESTKASTTEVQTITSRKTKKTNAQKCREYRERMKLQNTMVQNITAERSDECGETGQLPAKKPKTDAERRKKYYEAQKLKKQKIKKIPKTDKQRNKECYDRKKILQALNILNHHSVIHNAESNAPSKTKKTQSEHCKEYQQKSRLKKQLAQLDDLLFEKSEVPQSEEKRKELKRKRDCERQRAYYQRQKDLKKNEEKIKKVKTKVPKTNAERQREFRQRKAEKSYVDIKTMSTRSSQPTKRKVNDSVRETETTENQNNEEKTKTVSEIKMEVDDTNADDEDVFTPDADVQIYQNYCKHAKSHLQFYKLFTNNTFGHTCVVCDRLFWEKDLKMSCKTHENLLQIILPNYVSGSTVPVCSTCKVALDRQKIPSLSTYNGFHYPEIPPHLPKLDLISQKLISLRIPFTQIRRLRHFPGDSGVYGQIINIPVEVNTLVNRLPRSFEDDHSFYVNITNKMTYRSSLIEGIVNKKHVIEWLKYLISTPVYVHHKVTIDENYLNNDILPNLHIEEVGEPIPIEDNLKAQQQTLIWNEDMFLNVALGKNVLPVRKLFDENAEELSFPTIYGGQFRTYREGVHVSPFMQASSELRRTDRRGVVPEHLLYMAVKIMRQRVKDSVTIAFKHLGAGKEPIKSDGYIEHCIETNLAFLRCIPNSAWYWSDRKKELYSMIRQKGAPTAYICLGANETGWNDLIKLLYKLKNSGAKLADETLKKLSYVQKAALVNEDTVTCAIYFSKMLNCLMQVLQSKKKCPFGKYRVLHYFKRIEFQHRGSPVAHILLWLENAPADSTNGDEVASMVDELISVTPSEASGNIKLQSHQHTFQCYKKKDTNKQECRFGAPYMPVQRSIIITPMKENDENFEKYRDHYNKIRTNLASVDYENFEEFYAGNSIESNEHYYEIISAGIGQPQLFYKRNPSEKWHDAFNPFILHHLKSNMNMQIIHDEYSCAAYVAECTRRSYRDMSDMQRQIIDSMKHPDFDISQITREISVNIFNSIEMSTQEAAWYLLREPMAKSSIATVYIPTVHPAERQRIRKTLAELNAIDDDYSDICKENWFDKYEKRPARLSDVTLAQFLAKYCKNIKGEYIERSETKVIRYREYDAAESCNDYRREMVLLHIPFRSEDRDILADNKFIKLFEDNKDLISERRKEFESNADIKKTLELCRRMCSDDAENDDEESQSEGRESFEAEPYQQILRDPLLSDYASIGELCEKLRDNLMDAKQFQGLMKSANQEQRELLMHCICHLQMLDRAPFQSF